MEFEFVSNRLLELKNDIEFDMPFLGQVVEYTRDIFLGNHDCIFCKKYYNYLIKKKAGMKMEWIQYFKRIRNLFKRCFKWSVCSWNLISLQTQIGQSAGHQNGF